MDTSTIASLAAVEVEAVALTAWRRINAAVESGAPVPDSVYINGEFDYACVTYHDHPRAASPDGRAAAMVRALGWDAARKRHGVLPSGPTVWWANESWRVVAFTPAPETYPWSEAD